MSTAPASATPVQASTTPPAASDNGPFRALKHYNFRIFWLGQILSLTGSWMQGIAQSWLILVLADPVAAQHVLHSGGDATATVSHASTAIQATANRYQGLVNFWQGIPVLVLTLVAGVVIDRVNKRRLLMGTQFGFMLCAGALGLLIRFGVVQISEVMLIAFLVGLFMAFDMPTRQSFVVELVGRKDVPSAVALNSSLFNAARATGPAVAGLLLAHHVSLADCFFLNGASYTLVILSLYLMRGATIGDPPKLSKSAAEERLIDNFKAGFRYVWSNHTTRSIVLLVGTLGTFAFSFNVLIPTFVRFTLLPHAANAEQVKAFGFLETVRGVGALGAAVTVALFSRPKTYKWYLVGGGLLSNALLMVFALERNMNLAYVTMALVTYGFVLIFATANTVIQMAIPDELRGRIMAFYTLVFIGTGPIGSLMAGYLAQYIGAPWTIFAFAALTLSIVALLSFLPGGLLALRVPDASQPRPATTRAAAAESGAAAIPSGVPAAEMAEPAPISGLSPANKTREPVA